MKVDILIHKFNLQIKYLEEIQGIIIILLIKYLVRISLNKIIRFLDKINNNKLIILKKIPNNVTLKKKKKLVIHVAVVVVQKMKHY